MTSIIEKRRCLHRHLEDRQRENSELKFQVGQLQALANIGVNTAMIAHEINNLLTPLSNYAELALRDLDNKEIRAKALQKTVGSCERARKVMKSILAVANGEAQEKKSVRVLSLVEEIFSCLCRDFSKDGITVEKGIPEDLTVCAVPVDIQQVLMNLILNARDAMLPRGGILTIQGKEVAGTVEIEVKDTGCGIEADCLEKIFEPFFSTKADCEGASSNCGAGLGLAFCRTVLDTCGGSMVVESRPSEGSTFKVTLPKPQLDSS